MGAHTVGPRLITLFVGACHTRRSDGEGNFDIVEDSSVPVYRTLEWGVGGDLEGMIT